MSHSFYMGGPLCRMFAGALPVSDGLLMELRLRIMIRQEFWLLPGGLREAFHQCLDNLCVVLLSGALEQRLIGRLLNERMFEGVCRLGTCAALVQQSGLD